MKRLFSIIFLVVLINLKFLGQGTTCATATAITVDGACAPAATITDATANAPLPSCGTTAREGWYTFTLAAASAVTITGTNTNRNLALQLISGTCAGTLTELVCENLSGAGAGTETISNYNLTAGTYFVKVLNVGTNDIGISSLCITSAPPGPSNDDPTGAITITADPSCTYTTYTNASATATTCGTIPAPGCSSYTGGDVWFSVVVPAGGALAFDSQTGVMTDGGMAVYSGSACGAMTLLGCDDDASSNGAMPYLSLSGLTAGATLYIRFWEYGNNNNGTFGLCVSIPPAGPSNDNCSGATTLTVNPDFLCGTVTPGTIASATASADANTCGGTDDDDVWFKFVATGTSHTVDLLNVTGSTTDLYHAVFTGTCGSLGAPLLCSDPNSSTLTGLTAGTTYYVRVYSWTSTTGQTSSFNVCIGTPPPPPANDNCSGATTLTVNPNFLCGTVTPGTIVSATASADANTCGGTDDDDVWFKFVATGTSHTVDLLNVTGSTTDLYHAVFTGTCGSLGAPLLCSDPNSSTLTGLTAGTTYYVRVYSWTSTTGQTSSFNVCIGTPPPPPANDNCSGATTLTVNPDFLCGTVTPGTIASATASADANTCGGTDDDDVWFKFVATGTSHTVDLLNVTGSTTDLYHAVFTGTCGSLGAPLLCSDPNNSTLTGLTAGTTYYVRVYSWTSTTGQTSSFNICIGTPPPPPANDECTGAVTLTVNPDQACGTTTVGSIASATASADANSCAGTDDDDVWYKFVATSTSHEVDLLNVTGSTTDLYHSVYSGTCGAVGTAILCSDPNSSSFGGLTVGATYFVRVYSYTATAGQTTSFSICIGTPPPTGPCGNPTSNDYCSNPAVLTYNPGSSWTSSTSSLFSADQPANIASVFCGSIENNSWYQFTATATSHTFSFSNITNCNNNWGVQAQVYNVTTSGSLCCTNFTSVSNCYNPGTNTSGTVTATGLTIGNTYYLMVDGNAGDDCDFTVSNWSASGILPIELTVFDGLPSVTYNLLKWTTASETNNDYFTLERSVDGIRFEKLTEIDGAGNSSHTLDYFSYDYSPFNGIRYYRLKQTDFNGKYSYSSVIAIENNLNEITVSNVHPNPTVDDLNFDFYSPVKGTIKIQILDLTGRIVLEKEQNVDEGKSSLNAEMASLAKGMYSLNLIFNQGNYRSQTKIIKY